MTTQRPDPPLTGDERIMLRTFLDYHRATLAMKCDGLSDEELRRPSMPPSTLSLLGLVRHMAEVERTWFRRVINGEDIPLVWSAEGDFQVAYDASTATRAEAFGAWQAEIEHARRIEEAADSLDMTAHNSRWGEDVSLRFVIRIAAWRPRPSGRGGNAASPPLECQWSSIVCSHVPVPAAPHARPGSGAAGPLRARPVRVEPGRRAARALAPGPGGRAGLPEAVPAAHRSQGRAPMAGRRLADGAAGRMSKRVRLVVDGFAGDAERPCGLDHAGHEGLGTAHVQIALLEVGDHAAQ